MKQHLVSVLAVANLMMVAAAHADDDPARAAYATMAQALASPVSVTFEGARPMHSDKEVIGRMELARLALQGLTSLPSELAPIHADLLVRLDRCHRSMERLRVLDSTLPDFEGAARTTLENSPALWKVGRNLTKKEDEQQALTDADKQSLGNVGGKLATEAIKYAINSYNTVSERETYRQTYAETRTAAAKSLAMVASKYQAASGNTKANPTAFTVKFRGSWNNTFTEDYFYCCNNTGADLTNCTLAVSVNGYNATCDQKESDSHLHYVLKWPAGTWVYAAYPSKCHGGIATDQSADSVESVHMIALADQCSGEVNYTYIGADYDKDVKRYFETDLNPSFTGRWYNYDANHWLYNNGHEFSYKGTFSSFPV
jgi:hypothetical protein